MKADEAEGERGQAREERDEIEHDRQDAPAIVQDKHA